MKFLNRKFTLRESLLLIVLAALALGGIYYFLVDQPVRDSLMKADTMYQKLVIETEKMNKQADKMENMKKELDAIRQSALESRMVSYNHIEAETQLLNDIFKDMKEYRLTFENVTRENDQIRRNVRVTFTASDYNQAVQTIEKFRQSDCRYLIGNVTLNKKNKVNAGEEMNVSLTITFYETMVGGEEDAGLPKAKEKKVIAIPES